MISFAGWLFLLVLYIAGSIMVAYSLVPVVWMPDDNRVTFRALILSRVGRPGRAPLSSSAADHFVGTSLVFHKMWPSSSILTESSAGRYIWPLLLAAPGQ